MKCECFSASCENDFRQRKPIDNPVACLLHAILSSEFPSLQGGESVVGWTRKDPWIVDSNKDALQWCIWSYRHFRSFTQHFNWFTLHSFTLPLVSHSIFSYLSLTAFLQHEKKTPHFSSSSCSFQHQERPIIYPGWGSQCQSQHDTQPFHCLSIWQFWIRWPASSATIQESNAQAVIKWFLHMNSWKTSRGTWIYSFIGIIPISWALRDLYCLWQGGWKRACAACIRSRFRLSIWRIESTR